MCRGLLKSLETKLEIEPFSDPFQVHLDMLKVSNEIPDIHPSILDLYWQKLNIRQNLFILNRGHVAKHQAHIDRLKLHF